MSAELALMTPSIEALIYSYESSGQQSTHCTNKQLLRPLANDSHNRPFFIMKFIMNVNQNAACCTVWLVN